MLNIVLFGPPGAGKGTQAKFLVDQFNLIHISTGDLLREEIAKGSPLGLAAKDLISAGNLVPDSLVIGMIETKLEENKKSSGFIFDGFPRTVPQAIALDELLTKHQAQVTVMLSLEVEKEELIKRLLLRGETSGRTDDTDVATIENRIRVYHEKTAPIIDFYHKQGKHRPIEGVGSIGDIASRLKRTVEEVYDRQFS
jgi:adenylate kinase